MFWLVIQRFSQKFDINYENTFYSDKYYNISIFYKYENFKIYLMTYLYYINHLIMKYIYIYLKGLKCLKLTTQIFEILNCKDLCGL